MGVHAEPRTTKYLDIFIRSDEENSKAIFRALAQYGAPLGDRTVADFMDGATFQIGQPPARIDILQQIDGVTFDEAWANRIEGLIESQIQAAVISRNDRMRNKLATGWEQDISIRHTILKSATRTTRDSSWYFSSTPIAGSGQEES